MYPSAATLHCFEDDSSEDSHRRVVCVCVWCARTVEAFDRTVAYPVGIQHERKQRACVQSEPAKVSLAHCEQ